jgi:hypothetical protein
MLTLVCVTSEVWEAGRRVWPAVGFSYTPPADMTQ